MYCFIVLLYVYLVPQPYMIYMYNHTPEVRYSLFVLKVVLNVDKPTNLSHRGLVYGGSSASRMWTCAWLSCVICLSAR